MLGDVRVQRMFLGVVGKSRKMPGRQETTHWQTSALLLVRPGPPNNSNNKQANAAPGKGRKTINENKQREMRSEKNKCKYTGRESAIGNCDCVDCDHLLLPVLALLDCGSVVVRLWQCGCEYCHYLFMPQNVSFSFSFGQGSQRCCWLKET